MCLLQLKTQARKVKRQVLLVGTLAPLGGQLPGDPLPFSLGSGCCTDGWRKVFIRWSFKSL